MILLKLAIELLRPINSLGFSFLSVRIPDDADQRSGLMPITRFRDDGDQ
jgi:hypothetical protein